MGKRAEENYLQDLNFQLVGMAKRNTFELHTLVKSLVVCCLLNVTTGYKILCLTPVGPRSHLSFYFAVAHALAEKKHEVTLVTPYKLPHDHPNILRVGVDDLDLARFIPNFFGTGGLFFLWNMGPLTATMCNDALQHEQVQKLKEQDFDVVLMAPMMSDCLLTVPYHLQIPLVWLNPAFMASPFTEVVGSLWFSSFSPDAFLDYEHPLSFSQRLVSAFEALVIPFIMNFLVAGRMESECRGRNLCPEDMPRLTDLKRNGTIMLVNSVKTMEKPIKPHMANVIHVGGITWKLPELLPQDLDEWIQGSGEYGFIYFSLGSAIKTEDIPEAHLQTIIKVFSTLPQRILWKWNQDDMPNKPANVKIAKWLPQQDVIGHPQLKLFITHGGYQSVTESMFHGIPVLGIPVLVDQLPNLIKVEREGWGKFILWEDLSEDKLRSLITECINNHSMRSTVKAYSQLMRDQHYAPADEVNFWIEYVIRHKGAPHLRSPVLDLTWFELYNIDVWITALLALAAVFAVFVIILSKLVKTFLFFVVKKKKD